MAGGKDEKAQQAQEQLKNLRRQLEELEALYRDEVFPNEQSTDEKNLPEKEWRRRWYHSRLVEPALGILVGLLILVSLNTFLGIALKGFLVSIENRLAGEDVANVGAAESSTLYTKNCAGCHGEKGDKTTSGMTLKQYLSMWGDQAMSKVVREGKGSMPACGRAQGGALSDDEIGKIVRLIQSMDGGPLAAISPIGQRQSPTPVINSSFGDVVKHEGDWDRKHPQYVKDNGSNTCYRCHQQDSCTACHTGSN